MLTRHQIRTRVLQALYAAHTSGSTPEQVFNQLLADDYEALRKAGPAAPTPTGSEPAPEDAAFLRDLFFGALKRRDTHEARITPALENWQLDRVALIDRILLVMGTEELLHFNEIPVKVTINEYLDLAREFSTDKSSQFVNGILDKLYRQAKAEGQIHKSGKGLLDTPVLG
jgi:transcription antitermination factor NusB